MSVVTVKVEGLKELEDALKELENPNQRRTAARNALKKAAEPIREMAESIVPRRRGHLADNITVGTRVSGGGRNAQARQIFGQTLQSGGSRADAVSAMRDFQRAGAGLVEIHIGPGRHPQAITQEFGTWFHPPQPYMRPAFDAKSSTALEIIKTELWNSINKIKARNAKRAARRAK